MSEVPNRGALHARLRHQVALQAAQETSSDAAPNPPPSVAQCGLELTALSELLAEPDEAVDYLVEERIARGSVVLLAGKPKAGKSTAARGLALEVARGGSWLGFRCLPRPVWYLALEDKRSEVKRHFRTMGATGSEPVRFFFRQPTDRLIGQLHALAEREHPGLIVVDTLQRLIRAQNLNDYAEVTTKLTPILTLARETGAAMLLVHHAGKSERGGIDSILGSTALAGSVDNVFLLNRRDRYRLLSSIQRIGDDLAETVIEMDPAGKVTCGQSRHDADVGHVQAALLATLRAAGNGLTRTDWIDACEGRRQLKLEALKRIVDSGTAIRSGAGTKVDPFRYDLTRETDSGSQVPSKGWEPESSSPTFIDSSNVSTPDCGSQVPTVPEVPPTPETDATEVPLDGCF